jgi:RNA ligase
MKTLYIDLMNLVGDESPFFFKDFFKLNRTLRIFNYRLSSWTEFQRPGAKNCRGTMFDITDPENVKLISLPMEKFFNYEEGGVDHTQGEFLCQMVKMDGSLISSYLLEGELFLKSKGSLESDQALAAMAFLDQPNNASFKQIILNLELLGFTTNMEYTSPTNRIVVPYQDERLTVLQLRDKDSGDTIDTELLSILGIDPYRMVDFTIYQPGLQQQKVVDDIRAETSGEGYVIKIAQADGSTYNVKVKNTKYLTLHKTKDSITCPSRLFEVVINEGADDLRAMFWDDPAALNMVQEMENVILPIFNGWVSRTEHFFDQNKTLGRKEFAIKAQTEMPEVMGMLMNLYLNENPPGGGFQTREINWKEWAIKYRDKIFILTYDTTPVE